MKPRPTSTALESLKRMSAAEVVDFVKATIEHRDGYGPAHFNPIGYDYGNKPYYKTLPPETADKLRGLVTLEFAALLQVAKQLQLVYAKGGITGGAYAVREAVEKGVHTLYRLSEAIGLPRTKKRILSPNIRNNQAIGSVLQKQYPDHGIAAPTAREMSAHKAMKHRGFGGLQYQEVDFMALWYMLQMNFEHVAPSACDWNSSRNTINESAMETLIEFGTVPLRRSADIKPVDENGKCMPLSACMEKYAETIKVGLATDLDFREAAQAFAISATLDQWRRDGDLRVANRNARLRHPSRAELEKIDRLKAEINPFIKLYGAKNLRPKDLLPEYQEAHARAQASPVPPVSPELKTTLKPFADAYFANIEKATSLNLEPELAARLARVPASHQRRFDPEPDLFEPANRSLFFHDGKQLYDKCAEWEQALLPFAVWAMEIVLLPQNNPMAAVVVDDFKRGAHAKKYMDRHGISDVNEALPHAGADAGDMITDPARRAMRRRVQKIRKSRPGKVVIGPDEFQFIFDVMEELRATIPNFAGRGPNETSPAFRMLLKQTFVERNADELFFPQKWEMSPELVQLRNHARNIQCEFIERPVTGPVNFHIYTETPKNAASRAANDNSWLGAPDSLCADAGVLADEFRRCAASMTQAPEQGLALARLWARNQLIRPEIGAVNENFVRSAYAPPEILAFDKQEMDRLLGSPRRGANAPDAGHFQPGDVSEYHDLWGAGSNRELQARLRKVAASPLPEDAAVLLKKYAHLWMTVPERLAPEHAPDDTKRRAEAIDTEKQLMQGFAAASRSAFGFQEWLKSQRPTNERQVHAEGPQS